MTDPIARLRALEVGRGDDVAVALHAGTGLGLATWSGRVVVPCDDPFPLVAAVEREIGPRWVWWDRTTSDPLATGRIPVARSWDVLTIHRLLHGGWRTSIAHVWAHLHDLPTDSLPTMGQLDLLGAHLEEGDPDRPVRPDGHIRPEWLSGGWARDPERLADWAELALRAAGLQRA
ncbi:MAG: hypothetical protein ACLGHQ_05725, partial [Acidimicrobiia bacterium]